MATWLYRIGEAAARRAWAVILAWVLIIAGVAGAYTAFHGKLSNTFTMPGTQTQQLSDELAQRFPSANRGSGQIIITTGDVLPPDPVHRYSFWSCHGLPDVPSDRHV